MATERINYWESPWGLLISAVSTMDCSSTNGKLFRKRFRIPFPVLECLRSRLRSFDYDLSKDRNRNDVKVFAKDRKRKIRIFDN